MPDPNPDPIGGETGSPPPTPKPDLEHWRKRASDAEGRISELSSQLEKIERELASHKSRLEDSQRASDLASSGAVDAQVIASLIESMIRSKQAADFKTALAELRKSKPFLFRQSAALMPASPIVPERTSGFTGQPTPPSVSPRGDRRSLLDYLRSKRN